MSTIPSYVKNMFFFFSNTATNLSYIASIPYLHLLNQLFMYIFLRDDAVPHLEIQFKKNEFVLHLWWVWTNYLAAD